MTDPSEITRGLEGCHELVQGHPELRAEFLASRAEFFARPEAAWTPGAEVRHLEWFFLERPSRALGGVPVVALSSEEAACGVSPALQAALRDSIPGAFEVTTASDADGVWVRDLFGLGEHPLATTPTTTELQSGDLLVGRLFPGADGAFLASTAISVFRNPELLSAVRADLAAMRKARKGVLRVQQLELERLFHGPDSVPARTERPVDLRRRAEAGLVALGLSEAQATSLVTELRQAAENGKRIGLTELLNRLAFDTRVDLEQARRILFEAWHEAGSERETSATRDDARAALEAFDRGRREGKELSILFGELERTLGLDSESQDDSQEPSESPDFPGVIPAVVEEFLWDVEREAGPDRARRFEGLRILGDYARDIGEFEELGRVRLLDFSARWLLDETRLEPSEVDVVLEALQEFCVWAKEHHQLPLDQEFHSTLRGIRRSAPRLAGARVPRACGTGELAAVTRVEGACIQVDSGVAPRRVLEIGKVRATHLQAGDLVRLTGDGQGISGAYPGELAKLRGPA